MITITCDQCDRPIPSTIVSFRLRVLNDELVDGEVHFCTTKCLRIWTETRHPERRPDFAARRAPVGAPVDASVEDLDNHATRGEYDPDAFDEAASL